MEGCEALTREEIEDGSGVTLERRLELIFRSLLLYRQWFPSMRESIPRLYEVLVSAAAAGGDVDIKSSSVNNDVVK